MTKFLKRCWMPLAICIITAAIISSLFRALTPWAKQYKAEVEQHLTSLVGQPVTIKTMETGWYWFEPVVKLNQVNISHDNQPVVKLNKLLVGINLFSSLWHWQIQPGVLAIDDLQLNLHQINGRWQIDGIAGFSKQIITLDIASYTPVLAWILSQQKIIIKNLSAHLYLQDNTLLPLNGLNLVIDNHSGHYHVKGQGYLAQATATNFQLLADMSLDPYALNKTSGHAFFSIDHFLPGQWQGFIKQSRFHLLDGQSDMQLWAGFAEGRLKSLQASLNFHHVAWIDQTTLKKQMIKSLKANLAWNSLKNGWQLAVDQIQLRFGNLSWPENSLLVHYQEDSKKYLIFIKKLLLESLFSTSITWPDSMSKVLAMNPRGELNNTKLQFSEGNLDYALTAFSKLSWQTQDTFPGAANISGVLHWQPTEGRLELDSEQVVIKPKDKPPITFPVLNAAFDWKELSDGLRVSMERFVVSHPNLVLSASGVVDELSANSAGQLRMTAEFSANNAQKWLTYVPTKYLKPKLNTWLKNDIKRINEASGKVRVNGLLADFPFDKRPGEFSITSHLSGVDLFFAHNWPLTQDIEGYLHIDKRLMDVDIVHANLNGVVVDKGNLRVNDIGLDHETLLIHSQINTDSKKALAYVLSSPLSRKLSILNKVQMQGPLALDLRLEAPLYPENDTILALGDITFNNNKVKVHHSLSEIELNALDGSLQFDQQGVLDSNLKAAILGYPVGITIKSIRKPDLYTEIRIKGKTTAEVLGEKFNSPIFSLMHGTLWLESLLTLTDDPNDLEHLHIETSLHGFSIDLPPPLGKSAETKVPLKIDINFNAKKDLRLRFDYNGQLSSDLWFSEAQGVFTLQKGELRLGSSQAIAQDRQGVGIVGFLHNFDLQQWLTVKEQLISPATKNSLLEAINLVDVQLQEAKIWSENYKELAIKAIKLAAGTWSIRLNQENILANLRYQPASNTLTGSLDKLYIVSTHNFGKVAEHSNPVPKPAEMPNLDIQIASLHWNGVDMGNVSLKMSASTSLWRLNYCKIISPFYQFTATGEWKQGNQINSTNLQAELNIYDLAKSLERWKISPVVESHQGIIQFQGGWPGPLYDFSLAKMTGHMAIGFKEGRITNLSPETEEKLGLGKLLSILSLQTIPRRLKLDFSDLSEKGYSFDEFKGDFNIINGVMTTQDSYIDGPVAYASMKGNLDIVRQLYNLDLRISPHITASLPIVATIAGGPIAGIATWVVSKIINQGMQKISGYTYKISGPWRQPVVQQISIIKKLDRTR